MVLTLDRTNLLLHRNKRRPCVGFGGVNANCSGCCLNHSPPAASCLCYPLPPHYHHPTPPQPTPSPILELAHPPHPFACHMSLLRDLFLPTFPFLSQNIIRGLLAILEKNKSLFKVTKVKVLLGCVPN